MGYTGSIIEALERGNSVIHITENPIFEIYSDKIWKSIKCYKINENIFTYSLKKKGKLIVFGKKNRSIF